MHTVMSARVFILLCFTSLKDSLQKREEESTLYTDTRPSGSGHICANGDRLWRRIPVLKDWHATSCNPLAPRMACDGLLAPPSAEELFAPFIIIINYIILYYYFFPLEMEIPWP